MTTRASLSIAVAAIAAAGCQTIAPTAGGSCNQHECHVGITVNDCVIQPPDPDPIGIFAKNVEIHWDLKTVGYTFAPIDPRDPSKGGIAFKGDTQNQFDNPKLVNQDTKFIWHDKNTVPGTYRYTVRVMQGAAACPPLDPSIINN